MRNRIDIDITSLPPTLLDRLRREAAESGVPVTTLARMILVQYLRGTTPRTTTKEQA